MDQLTRKFFEGGAGADKLFWGGGGGQTGTQVLLVIFGWGDGEAAVAGDSSGLRLASGKRESA